MAANEIAMDDERFSIDKVLNSLPGRVLLVVLASAGFAVLGSLLIWINRGVQESVLAWGVVGVIGLACGLSARWLFPGHTAALRLWTAFLGLLAGLVLLGLTTQGAAGARLPEPSQAGLNWTWLGQFAFGALLAWLAQAAFTAIPTPVAGRKRRTAKGPTAPPRSRVKGAGSQTASEPGGRPAANGSRQADSRSTQTRSSAERPATGRSASRQAAPRSARIQPSISKRPAGQDGQTAEGKTGASPHAGRVSSASPNRPAANPRPVRPTVVVVPPPAERPGGMRARLAGLSTRLKMRRNRDGGASKSSSSRGTQPSVRLVGEEEHRCPYCLELVAPHDPRGIVECPICHTRHHADCWAVTGVCQVPHFNG